MPLSDAEMFEWAEAQRALVASMSNDELAALLIGDVFSSVSFAESNSAVTAADHEEYRTEYGALREAAYRLAGLREYEQK